MNDNLNDVQFRAEEITGHLREQHPDAEITIHSSSAGHVVLSRIVFPKSERGRGRGSDFMRTLTAHADQHGYTVALTPSTDFGASSKARLERFYKGHGFVSNKGRRKDYGISESMYRPPSR